MITNPAVEPPSPSPILDKTEQPYSHSDPFVSTPSDLQMHSQQQSTDQQQHPPQTNDMDPPSPRTEAQGFPLPSPDDPLQDPGNYHGGGPGYYGDSYNGYQQQGYPANGYPQQGSQGWQHHHQGNNMEYYHQHHQGGVYPHNYYNHSQHPSNYPPSDPYYQQQQIQNSQYYQHPHGHHHLHPHQANNGPPGGGGGGSNNCTPSPHAGSDDSSGDAVNETKPSPHYFQQQYPHVKPGYPGGPLDMYGHPSQTNLSDTSCPPAPGNMMPHNTSSGYVKPEMGTQPISTSVLKRPRSSLLPAPKRSKKSSRHRDPNEPQKPVSAYALFFRDTQAQIKSRSPAATFGEVSKMVAALWDQLDPDSKANYKRRTETAKKEYLKRLAAYRASLVSKGEGSLLTSYNIGGGSSGFAYPTPRSAGVAHLPGNIPNPNLGDHDALEQPSKLGLQVHHENNLRNDRVKDNSTSGDISASHATNPHNGRQFSPINHQPFPSPNSHHPPSQHSSMKPIAPAPHQSQSNTYGAHHHIGSQVASQGGTVSSSQSSQPMPMGGGPPFHAASDLHQTPQSNTLGAGHLQRANYQQPGRVS